VHRAPALDRRKDGRKDELDHEVEQQARQQVLEVVHDRVARHVVVVFAVGGKVDAALRKSLLELPPPGHRHGLAQVLDARREEREDTGDAHQDHHDHDEPLQVGRRRVVAVADGAH
jgi:hypothetical protein